MLFKFQDGVREFYLFHLRIINIGSLFSCMDNWTLQASILIFHSNIGCLELSVSVLMYFIILLKCDFILNNRSHFIPVQRLDITSKHTIS